MTNKIEAGDIVWANPCNRSKWNAGWWALTHTQPFRVEEVRKQFTGPILVLRGLWTNVREVGSSPDEYIKLSKKLIKGKEK